MAELYQQNAARSEPKTLCSKIGTDQRSDKPQMEQWSAQGIAVRKCVFRRCL